MRHDPSRWDENILRYTPLDMDYKEWLEKSPYVLKAAKLGNHILEVGGGSGLGCLSIKKEFPEKEVTYSDTNDEVCRLAVKRFAFHNVKIPVKKIDAFTLPFDRNAFDVVYHEGVAEHYDEPDIIRMLREHLRVAKFVVMDVPTKWGLGMGGYGDERKFDNIDWHGIVFRAGKIVEQFFREKRYGCVLTRRLEL